MITRHNAQPPAFWDWVQREYKGDTRIAELTSLADEQRLPWITPVQLRHLSLSPALQHFVSTLETQYLQQVKSRGEYTKNQRTIRRRTVR